MGGSQLKIVSHRSPPSGLRKIRKAPLDVMRATNDKDRSVDHLQQELRKQVAAFLEPTERATETIAAAR